MCGIAGILGLNDAPADRREVEAMCSALVLRGPDDEGYYVEGPIGLGMRRLSIIDLATGQQPVHNEDGSIQVVLNGEIYNFQSLREDLEAAGHTFYTASDTEVIVHLYEEYGADCVQRLRGMFAFALWDARRRKLLLVRDRLGIKPLFFGEFDGRLAFASELKAILQLPWIPRALNWNAVARLFTSLTTPGDQSIVAGVHKLPPGHLLEAGPGCPPRVTRYWDVRFEADLRHDEDWFVERLRALLRESVGLRMICDVPFGAFLSGGIDSSAVVATMAGQSDRPIRTFSIGYREKSHDELDHARQVAHALGTEHHERVVTADVADLIGDLAWHLDEPFGDSSAIPTYLVSQVAAEHVKVALSGDGGDELFAGYDKYCVERRERRYRHVPAAVRSLLGRVGERLPEGARGRRFLRHIALDGTDRYLDAGTLFDAEAQTALFLEPAAERVLAVDPWKDLAASLGRGGDHWLSALQYTDIRNYLPLDILTKVDRMSMAHSLEVRVPLLDHKLVEFAATIPPALKLRGSNTKYIFKRAMRGILPDAIIDRRKQGFAVPLGHWFRGELNSFVRDLLLSPTAAARRIINPRYVEHLLALHEGGRPLDLQIWTLISFELWCRTFLDAPPAGLRNDPDGRAWSAYPGRLASEPASA